MLDGVIITIDMVVKPECAEAVCAAIPAMFEDTVMRAGFRSIRVVRHQMQSNRLFIVEHWDKEEDYRAYHQWRNRAGELDKAEENLLSITTDVWPMHIGFAAV